MSSDRRNQGLSGENRAQKSVRFATSETTREILEKSTWRRLPTVQETTHVMSAKARQGKAVVKFVISKMLFVRLPTARRAELETYCARLLSADQLAAWWSQLSPSNQALVGHSSGSSTAEMAFSFCEAMAEICERHGNQLVTDTLSPLVIPVISSWETSGEIANVDDTNAAAETAAKGKKAGNALGEARSRCFKEYQKRSMHYGVQRDSDLELKRAGRATRFSSSCVPLHGANLQEYTIYFITNVRGEADFDQEILGAGVSSQVVVARELAAEQALANWHICEAVFQRVVELEPYQAVPGGSKPLRKRDKTRAGKPQSQDGTSVGSEHGQAPSPSELRQE